MRYFFVIFILTVMILQSAIANEMYDMSTPLEGQSIASDSLQIKVLKDLYPIAAKKNSLCTNFKISDTQLLHPPYDVVKKKGEYVKGYWKELWTVDYCGEKIQIPVSFKINKKNTYYSIDYIN